MYLIIAANNNNINNNHNNNNNNNQKPQEEYSINYETRRFFKPNIIHRSYIICYMLYIISPFLSSTLSVLFPRLYTLSTHLAQSIPHNSRWLVPPTKERTNIHQDTQGRLLFCNTLPIGDQEKAGQIGLLIPIAFMSRRHGQVMAVNKMQNIILLIILLIIPLLLPADLSLSLSLDLDSLRIPWPVILLFWRDISLLNVCIGLTLSFNGLTRD